MEQSIVCSSIHKSVSFQQTEETILEMDSFIIHQGEQIAIMGPSGSGKTTLLNLVSGLDVPTSGKIEVFGETISALSEEERGIFRGKHIGIVFQEFQLFPYMTAIENILVQGMANQIYTKGEAIKKAKELLIQVGLENRLEHKVRMLSKGQQQRVAIARALFHNPKLLLVDEPTSNLDAKTGLDVIDLIKKVSKELNCTLVVVTHDKIIANLFSRIEYMESLNNTYAKIITEVAR